MDQIQASDIPHSLSIIPCYSSGFTGRKICMFVTLQLAICIISSICLSYFLFKKLYTRQKESWKTAVEIIKPIGKRLQNLEKERIIWNSYVEWIEDYCSVYYGLLNYINWTVSDLDKLYKNQSKTFRTFSNCSVQSVRSEFCPTKVLDSQGEGGLMREGSWPRTRSEHDVQLVANFARVFAGLKLKENGKVGKGDAKSPCSSLSGYSMGLASTVGTNVSSREEVDAMIQDGYNDDARFSENLEMLYLKKRNMCNEERTLYPLYEGSMIAEES